jgi:hypothetical protein
MFLSIIIFCIIVTVCKINPDTSIYIKKVLNDSCDFNNIQLKTSEILNNIKKYIDIEEIFVWEE